MAKTAIDWATDVWNPVTGCTPVSTGCQNCYAKRMSKRLAGRYGYPKDEPFRVTRHPDKLEEPLKWKKPRRIFVCSMADIFHDLVEDWALDEIFGVMLACRILNNIPDHTFMILTKRPERMLQYFNSREPMEHIKAWANVSNWITIYDEDMTFMDVVYSATCHDWDENGRNSSGSEYRPWGYINKLWPLPNVWLGVTAENQQAADERIPILLQTPAAVRFVSVEPMLSAVNLTDLHYERITAIDALSGLHGFPTPHAEGPKLDWVICGGESGPNARPMHPDWARSLRDQCQAAAGVPFFFKQWGEWEAIDRPWKQDSVRPLKDNERWLNLAGGQGFHGEEVWRMRMVGKKRAGRLLDGREWNEIPEVRV